MSKQTCGCDIFVGRRGLCASEYEASAGISRCPMHAAAPAMYQALVAMRKTLLDAGGNPMPTLDAVIAMAEGRK